MTESYKTKSYKTSLIVQIGLKTSTVNKFVKHTITRVKSMQNQELKQSEP